MKFDLLSVLNKKIPRRTKICFLTGVIMGWITHFYMLTHKLVNWDDANNMSAYGSGDYLGRWFLKYIHPLGGVHSIPAVHGFLFILLVAASACLILEIAGIRSTTGAVFVPLVLVTFPSMASTMTFMFMAHTSGMGIFMVCLAVYLLRKYRLGSIACGVLLLCVLGTYQSYISFAITLMLLGMINDLINQEKTVGAVFKEGLLCVAVLVVSVVVYIWLSHVIYPNLDNETYGGVGSMGQIAPAQVPVLIGRCYKRFLEFFLWKPFAFMTGTKQAANIGVCALGVVLLITVVMKRGLYKDYWKLALLLVVCGFVPLAAAFVYFMAPEVDYSMLMLYSYALVYVLVLALLDNCLRDWSSALSMDKIKKYMCYGLSAATVAVMFLSCYTDYLLTNKAYLRTDLATQRVSSYFNRVIGFAEATQDFAAGDELTILGEFYYKDNPSSVELDVLDAEDLRTLDGVALENGLLTSGVRDNFIKIFVGYETARLSDGEKKEIMETDAYQKMPVYPSHGSVQRINGVWVVKMCD